MKPMYCALYIQYLRAPKSRLLINLIYRTEAKNRTRMWADAQRDVRPAEYLWRPLRKFRNSIPCTTPQSLADARMLEYRAVTLPIEERKTWTQSEFCTWQNSVRGKSCRKCIHSVPSQETAKHPAKFG